MSEHYHFVGIGGAGMSALARILAAQGEEVSGSDAAATSTLDSLEHDSGIHTSVGHNAENVTGADLVVATAAVRGVNAELEAAERLGIPIVSRAEMLGVLMDRYAIRIAVSGTHGKTTTSAMIAQMLDSAGLDPTSVIGGDVPAWNSNARLGKSEVFVAEACEAYGSFLQLKPTISVITNVEADHLDYYDDIAAILQAFRSFLGQTSHLAILCADDPGSMSLADSGRSFYRTYGVHPDADIRAEFVTEGTGNQAHVFLRGELLGTLSLSVPGRHNLINALAAVAVGLELGVPFVEIARGLAQFQGTGRRFEIIGLTKADILIVDDYAHHPTELIATLSAARLAYPSRRIVAVFQPHLPSRTRDMLDEFAKSFADADMIVLTDIYLSREQALPGITGELLARRVRDAVFGKRVDFVADKHALAAHLRHVVEPGDLVITLGAGDIRMASNELLGMLAE